MALLALVKEMGSKSLTLYSLCTLCVNKIPLRYPGGGTPYDGLYGEAPPERGTLFRLQVYESVGISLVEVYKRVGNLSLKSVKGPKRTNR